MKTSRDIVARQQVHSSPRRRRVPGIVGLFAAALIGFLATEAAAQDGGCSNPANSLIVCIEHEDLGGGLSAIHYWFTYVTNYMYGPIENGSYVQFYLCGTDNDWFPSYQCGLGFYQEPVTLGGASGVYTYYTYSPWGGLHAEVHTRGIAGTSQVWSPGVNWGTR